MNIQRRRAMLLGAVLACASVVVLLFGLGIGSTGVESVLAMRHDPVALQIVWDIRLPRTLGAWLAGMLLGLAGAVAQGLFRNPLADPYLLGSASGASLGVALALLAFGHVAPGSIAGMQWLMRLGLTGAAFAGAVLAVLITLTLANGVQQSLRLLLAGVIVGVVLGAIKDLVVLGSADLLQAITGFMLGSTGLVGWSACAVMAATGALCLICAWALAPVLDGLALGESTAASLGLPLGAMRVALVAVLALATGAAVAQTGLIAFVGLAAPHLVRSVVKTTHAGLIVLSAAMGGLLLMAADLLARWLIAPQELPVGILTAVLGGSYLLWLMHRRNARGVS
ncbi:FecCD family ABC transporter permease [Variovorax sp. RHLX14]|uniref:FecCD family ABC transporter permease n=1 Tax=Variovorax sp. RHLX14 TaxID=1259731 RepID=UPI003F461065